MYSCTRAGLYSLVRGALAAAVICSALPLTACNSDQAKDGTESAMDPASLDSGAEPEPSAPTGMDAALGPAANPGVGPTLPNGRDAARGGGSALLDASMRPGDATTPAMGRDAAMPPVAACGGPGQACCPGDRCAAGCCVNAICLANGTSCGANFGMCMGDGCTDCGAPGQTCCPGRTCRAGAACGTANSCVACGGDNQRCCADGQCAAGSCVGWSGSSPGVCRAACGGADQMCCPTGGFDLPFVDFPNGAPQCVAELACLRGKCGRCGGQGEACCPGMTACEGTLQCLDSVCQKCGQPGQACCAPTPLNLDGCAGPLNSCQNGACTGMNCGLLNEACCPSVTGGGVGSCSATGTICTENVCRSCGGMDEPCCATASGARTCSVRGALCMGGTCRLP